MLFFVFVFFFLVVLPMVLGSMAILTEHQRKMAKLRLEAGDSQRIEVLERKVAELSALVHEQAIALDGVHGRFRSEAERVEHRLSV